MTPFPRLFYPPSFDNFLMVLFPPRREGSYIVMDDDYFSLVWRMDGAAADGFFCRLLFLKRSSRAPMVGRSVARSDGHAPTIAPWRISSFFSVSISLNRAPSLIRSETSLQFPSVVTLKLPNLKGHSQTSCCAPYLSSMKTAARGTSMAG